MTTSKDDLSVAETGVMLKKACPDFVSATSSQLARTGRLEIARQLEHVMVPAQRLDGRDNDFSFMAYPVPRLNREQREAMNLVPREKISIQISESGVRIDLDDFGKINWFYISRWPEVYKQLHQHLSQQN